MFITFLMCSRISGNPDQRLEAMLNNMKEYIDDKEKPEIEILIKFDSDDIEARDKFCNRNFYADQRNLPGHNQPNLLKIYPLNIRHFIYNRGEGRHSLQNDYMFLFSQRHPQSKFISFVTDDCFFMTKDFVQTLRNIKDSDFSIIGDIEPKVTDYKDYRSNSKWKMDVTPFPIVSTKLLEVLQNTGWQVNIDNWLTILHIILKTKYNIDLWKVIPQYIGRWDQKRVITKSYNPFEIDDTQNCSNPYYFDLIEQQAKNVALNYWANKFQDIANNIQTSLK